MQPCLPQRSRAILRVDASEDEHGDIVPATKDLGQHHQPELPSADGNLDRVATDDAAIAGRGTSALKPSGTGTRQCVTDDSSLPSSPTFAILGETNSVIHPLGDVVVATGTNRCQGWMEWVTEPNNAPSD